MLINHILDSSDYINKTNQYNSFTHDDTFNDLVHVDATNIVQLCNDLGSIEYDKIGCCVPPWKNMWCEWKNNSKLKELRGLYGVHCFTIKGDEITKDVLQGYNNLIKPEFITRICTYSKIKGILACLSEIFMLYDKAGNAITSAYATSLIPEISDSNAFEYFHNIFQIYLSYAMGMCHCVNVDVKKEETNYKKINKERRAQKKSPFFKFHTIQIKGKNIQKKDNRTTTGSQQSLHLVRGHFKEYTSEKPLLGKHVGKFWFQQHMAGKLANGVVNKNYKI